MIYKLRQKAQEKKWDDLQLELNELFTLWKDVETKKTTPKEINKKLGYPEYGDCYKDFR